MEQRLTYIIMLLSAYCFLLSACTTEEKGIGPEKQPPETERPFTLTMVIPGTSIPTTYALSADDENAIHSVDILVLEVSEKGAFYHHHIAVDEVAQPGALSSVKQIGFSLEEADVQLLVLANVRHLFTNTLTARLEAAAQRGAVGKEELMEYFSFDFSKPWGKAAFPMYGESGLIGRTDTGAEGIQMKRAVCRIDIGSGTTGTSVGTEQPLVIDSVFVFHARSKAYLAPAFDGRGNILEKPNVPEGAQPNSQCFAYAYTETGGKGLSLMEGAIYIAEDTQEEGDKETTLVIKAAAGEEEAQYYRIKLSDKEGKAIPFVRNYRYRVIVMAVAGEGYPTAREAALAPASAISFVDANELELRAIEFNDYYLLGLSTDSLAIGSGENCTLDVYTTYGSWSAGWKEGGEALWLSTPTGEYPSSVTSLGLQAAGGYAAETDSRAALIIRAGTLSREVIITYRTTTEEN
ncbi:putative small secreted protein [Parabacteroides sp. PF5-5]|nr:putative small secreted protein [Parabacteroides sp. PF5-13]MDH6328075.1 putative small secreted protein [Parabacteroides sp. PH5-41]MDH6335917.1 putative small secreted protein [Parabacteroides sp. PF5-5]MDH6346941.1 putative small secreted protein [Parabacteroides sp. PH5-46]MDH6361903.1 putative small secreted protein [Parabacteroides sp. PH5-16]MDH6377571.1 putative small secreted protein [Parabacteroides sp. PH5-33]